MNPERWQKVKSVLEKAIEIPTESRSAFLAKSCGTDEDLRREVEKLLEFEEVEGDVFEQEAVSAILENDFAEKNLIGKKFGNYKIVCEIGRGGMGVVFLAERADGEFEQKVAVKIIKNDFSSRTVINRFRQERQILASLSHRGIARLLDGGTTAEGLPFFVMEFVEGKPITEFCDENNLSAEQRLKLFIEVCAAVEHAHQHGVIHRDLKPSNILVRSDSELKLLDFGIAKVLNESANSTNSALTSETLAFVMTPEYASPEQIRGEKLTVATDIYSLGVILYELLTGQKPYITTGKSYGEILQTICETEPRHILNAERGMRNAEWKKKNIQHSAFSIQHLNNVVLKALSKESERRYGSAAEFAADIQNFLDGLPVSAKGENLVFRAEKIFKQNRLKILSAAFLALLLAFAGTIFYLKFKANPPKSEEQSALEKFKTKSVEALRLYKAGREKLGQQDEKGFRESIIFFEEAIAQDAEFALAYAALAESYSNASGAYLSPSEALPKQKDALVKALALDKNLAEAHISLAGTLIDYDHDWTNAEKSYQRAVEIAPDSAAIRREYAWFLTWMGRTDEALRELKIAKEIQPIASPPIEMDIGTAFYTARNYDEAIKNFQTTLRAEPDFAAAHRWIGWCLAQQGKFSEALAAFEKARKISDSDSTLAAFGYAQARLGNQNAARKILQELEKRAETAYVNPLNPAYVYLGLGEKKRAIELLEKSIEQNYGLIWLKSDPFFDQLRNDENFQKLLKKLNFPS